MPSPRPGDIISPEEADLLPSGYITDANSIVGRIMLCDTCAGEGIDRRGNSCQSCDGYSMLVNFGKVWQPLKDDV